jgi:HlyD family secretion protein
MSKDLKPKKRIGQVEASTKKKIIMWVILLAVIGGGGWYAYQYTGETTVEVPVARVRKGEFIISVRTRGEIRSTKSRVLSAPQVPDLQITTLVTAGKRVKKGDVVVAFDAAANEQRLLEENTEVRTVDSEIVQMRASHKITDEQDEMNLMTAEYNLERSKLDASKAEVISEIEGAKYRIDVGISEGELGLIGTVAEAHGVAQEADLERLQQKKDKSTRDLDRVKGYLSKMVIYAPIDGIVHVLPNFRASGSFGSKPPGFKEGDTAWTGAAIAEIPDLSEMRIELSLEEVERGMMELDQVVRIRVDAIPDREFDAKLDWISPIAEQKFGSMGTSDKLFPARATLMSLDERLRPGMSASAEVIIESLPDVILVPERASFLHEGKPSVYVQKGQEFEIREIEVGQRNDSDIVVLNGLQDGEVVALEDPDEAAKRAKKL